MSLLISVFTASLVGKMNLQSNTPIGGGGGTGISPRHVSMPFVPEGDMPNFMLSFALPASLTLIVCFQVDMQPGRTVM
ncbi:MAG: hypothetical protein IPL67_10845 [Ignavibacteria bacterium]|nr:hypothetical protein [Ignavibacteria bacterium]